MFVRCAFFIGDVNPSNRDKFDRCVIEEVAPQVAKFPGCREVRVLCGREYQDGAQDFYMVVEHYYDSLEDIHNAIASENRDRVWHHLNKVLPLFEGRVTHMNAEVRLVTGEHQ